MNRVARSGGVLPACVLSLPVLAGPDWKEASFGTGDAGSLPGDAQVPLGQSPLSPLESINGALAGFSPGLGDFQDMYAIFIVDPLDFSAVADSAGAFTVQMFLFAAAGFGILGQAGVGPIAAFGNMSNDGSGAGVTAPGVYYLAVAAGPSVPLSSTNLPIFFFGTPGEISGPDGPGGGSPVATWSTTLGTGGYTIVLNGAGFVPCVADVTRDGFVDVDDLVEVIVSWGPCAGCQADIDGNGVVGVQDLVRVIVHWGMCEPDV